MEALLKELEGKDISEVVAGGLSKLASVPSGGGGVAAAPAAGILRPPLRIQRCPCWRAE